MAGISLLVFIAAGLLTVICAVIWGGVSLTKPPVTWSAFLDGKTTKQIADSLADTPMPQAAAKLERGLSWLAIGDLGPRVRQGCARWLFLSDELTVYRNAEANALARAAELAQVKNRLASQGIELLVVVVPDKTRIADQLLCGLRRPAAFEHRVDNWIKALPGVNVLSLAGDMQDPQERYFLRTDTHWNEKGAATAANAIAQRLREPGGFELPTPTLHMRTEVSAVVRRPGDLVRLAGIDWLPEGLQPPADMMRPTRFIEIGGAGSGATDPAAKTGDTGDDLFGDTGLPSIAVLGTSFSRNASFIPFLETALGTRVGNFARDGGEFAGAAHAYFNSASFKDTPPKLVIWEIPERSLQRPLAGEPAIWPAVASK
ncbi:cell division protein FtsQ [Pigmentiphaga aceris]|uniref:Cell division protein FtsQ n=1 Tax=Pigmentiphaga aceris TaxID=1940612 RepID=A0A5C0B432_9BURK|nr:cell division protein FtsQ [Pigmentiphaga aceris]